MNFKIKALNVSVVKVELLQIIYGSVLSDRESAPCIIIWPQEISFLCSRDNFSF